MNRGPAAGHIQSGLTYAEKAVAAWGDVPDWVAELANQADAQGAKAAGASIGYSNSAVSVVLNRGAGIDKFDLVRIEQAVRGALMGATVICPRKGEMARDVCLDWQSKPKGSTSPDRIRMYRACRSGCPNSSLKGGKNAD